MIVTKLPSAMLSQSFRPFRSDASEKGRRLGDLVRLPHAAERNHRSKLSVKTLALFLRLREPCNSRSFNRSWADYVDAVVSAGFQRTMAETESWLSRVGSTLPLSGAAQDRPGAGGLLVRFSNTEVETEPPGEFLYYPAPPPSRAIEGHELRIPCGVAGESRFGCVLVVHAAVPRSRADGTVHVVPEIVFFGGERPLPTMPVPLPPAMSTPMPPPQSARAEYPYLGMCSPVDVRRALTAHFRNVAGERGDIFRGDYILCSPSRIRPADESALSPAIRYLRQTLHRPALSRRGAKEPSAIHRDTNAWIFHSLAPSTSSFR
jgi:hypothetical protein